MSAVHYVYAIVPAAEDAAPPAGLDDTAVTLEREGPIAALVSKVSGGDYSVANIEVRTADLDWLGPRAAAHDRVITWASDRGPAVPLPMFSLYHAGDGVRAMLRDRREELERALASAGRGREYTLRIYRDDEALRVALPALRPEFADRAEAIRAASPGQRYLLEKKLDRESREAVKGVAREVATEVFDDLRAFAVDSVREPPPRRAGDPAQVPLSLNAFFLVPTGSYEAFRAALTELIERYDGKGFRFEFTGPWPAYHFVGARADVE